MLEHADQRLDIAADSPELPKRRQTGVGIAWGSVESLECGACARERCGNLIRILSHAFPIGPVEP